jgi:cupin superfamily acireductone dioxygenase involved in methionine salvage
MEILTRQNLKNEILPGRGIQKAIGKDGYSHSSRMTMGFARYCAEYGTMEPHHHAEEILYIINAKDGWVRFGESKNDLKEKVFLQPGMILHIPEQEWHVFGFEQDGFVDAIFFYGQVENIRPESTPKNR